MKYGPNHMQSQIVTYSKEIDAKTQQVHAAQCSLALISQETTAPQQERSSDS